MYDSARMLKWIGWALVAMFLLVLLSLPLFFNGAAWWTLWKQDDRMARFIPTTARIDSIDISEHVSSGRTRTVSYEPVATYTFSVGGESFTADGVFAVGSNSGGYEWASSIVERFKLGEKYPAWYDPNDPRDAFIVREYSFVAATQVLCTAPFVVLFDGLVGFGVLAHSIIRKPIQRAGGWFEVPAGSSLGRRIRMLALLTIFWYGTALLAVGDYCRGTFTACSP